MSCPICPRSPANRIETWVAQDGVTIEARCFQCGNRWVMARAPKGGSATAPPKGSPVHISVQVELERLIMEWEAVGQRKAREAAVTKDLRDRIKLYTASAELLGCAGELKRAIGRTT